MKKNKFILLAIVLFCFTSSFKAQKNIGLNNEQKKLLLNQWHESPKESKDGNFVFRTTPFIVPINEPIVPQLTRLQFLKDKAVNVVFLKSCNYTEQEVLGKWNLTNSQLILDFGGQKCKYTILEIEQDKLTIQLVQ